MRAFYLAFGDTTAIVPQAVGQLNAPPELIASMPWWHIAVITERLTEPAARLWYARQALENGWSRAILEHWIDSDLYRRQGKAITNFKAVLPPAQSDLAQQILKDPYIF